MLTTSYDHYVEIPMSMVDGGFQEPRTVLFYTERTEGYAGEKIEGIDETFEMTGDFVSATLRVMPAANEPERYQRIIEQIKAIKGMMLSEYQQDLGANPFKFGMVGSTDTHTSLATAGEMDYFGKAAMVESSTDSEQLDEMITGYFPDPEGRDYAIRHYETLAAGLVAVWATGNTRKELWDAMV